eukprot:gb/GECH01011643.1/.p1 GENE.gb/GECH01011643.1/~~gb/GECH01011643.1/.p1  ORF type:complete len:937 (+),score=196.25 gb/GECH01011643.1/:1-2811(+)
MSCEMFERLTKQIVWSEKNPLLFISIFFLMKSPSFVRVSVIFLIPALFAVTLYFFSSFAFHNNRDQILDRLNMSETDPVVLPKDVTPSSYNLVFEPDLVNFEFQGEEKVEIKVNKNTDKIVLNTKEIEIYNGGHVVIGDKTIKVTKVEYDDSNNNFTTLYLSEELKAGNNATLHLKFKGYLNDQMAGFYRSKYEVDGETRYMAVTQFEAVDARRAFPCWDEPAVKARFQVTLIVPKDRVAVSNMPEESVKDLDESNKKIVSYKETPTMSTYILAFVVGELDYIERIASNGVRIRVYTPLGKTEQGEFALDVATRILPYYEEFFDSKYPLPKLDLLAIPDFSAGAMENWGCVTYRETALLVDPKASSAFTKQWVALVVCHELAHMWFGNLVTMEWWTHLWLNEGFATWVQYMAVDKLFPEWSVFEQFVSSSAASALELDGLKSSHPIEVDVGRADTVDQIFDAISYSKGCAVIRMLINYLGKDKFRSGLISYLKKHMYDNAATTDLWEALSESSGEDVSKLMALWTRQTGYPVVTVSEASGNKVKVSQQRFLSSGAKADETMWRVPLSYISSENPTEPKYILLSEAEETVDIPANASWIKFNSQQTGFFRVNYSEAMWKNLVQALKDGSLSPIDRLGVQADATTLARAGLVSTDIALDILTSFENEDKYTVWSDVLSNLRDVHTLIQEHSYVSKLNQAAQKMLAPIADKLGWEPKEGEPHLDSMLRPLVLSNLVRYDHKNTIESAAKRFKAFIADPDANSIPADMRATVYRAAVAHGGKEEWQSIFRLYESADFNEEKVRCLRSLGATKDPDLLHETLELSLSKVRSQDIIMLFVGSTGTIENAKRSWKFVKEHWDALAKRLDSGMGRMLFGRILKFCTTCFSSENDAQDVKEFLEKNRLDEIERAINQTLEKININVEWLKRDENAIKSWLERKEQ